MTRNQQLPRLHCQGRFIVNEHGGPLILHGINFGGWLMMEGYMLGGLNIPESDFKEKLRKKHGTKTVEDFTRQFRETWVTEQDFQNVKRLGFNCVRLPINYRMLEKDSFKYDERGFRFLDRVLRWFEKYGIYVIFDLHAAPGGQNPDWHSDSGGRARLWNSTTFHKRTVELWREIARRFRNRSVIAGYDLLNEAVTDDPKKLNRLYRDIVRAIRSTGDRHIVILEANRYAQQLDALDPPFDDNTMVSIHHYAPHGFTFHFDPTLTYPGRIREEMWNKKRLEMELKEAIQFSKKFDVPIFVGEFGISSRCANCQAEYVWVRDTLGLFRKHDFHWTYWTYKSVAGSFFPDGLYQLTSPGEFFRPHEPQSGLPMLGDLFGKDGPTVLDRLRTENSQLNKPLAKILRSMKRKTP